MADNANNPSKSFHPTNPSSDKELDTANVELIRIEGAGHADFGPKPQEPLDKITAFVQKQLMPPVTR
jgi:fermentation-respiration switch protein FrsA (DUF1100 family)